MARTITLLVISFMLISCLGESKQETNERAYGVRLSSWSGGETYYCDSVIWITDTHIKLQYKEYNKPMIDIVVPNGVLLVVFKRENSDRNNY